MGPQFPQQPKEYWMISSTCQNANCISSLYSFPVLSFVPERNTTRTRFYTYLREKVVSNNLLDELWVVILAAQSLFKKIPHTL